MNGKNQQLRVNGQRVFLRYPQKSDAAEFIALNNASRGLHQGLVSPPLDEKSFGAYLTRNELETNAMFFICQNVDEKICGAINLSQMFRGGFQNAYLGYFIGAEFGGRGMMTESVGLILRFAFKNLKLHRIEANVQPENTASIAILRKNGFVKEGFSRRYLKVCGRWRDHERWAIIVEDWKLRNKK